jgi:NitT/TauT family transport system ATP-binding protein
MTLDLQNVNVLTGGRDAGGRPPARDCAPMNPGAGMNEPARPLLSGNRDQAIEVRDISFEYDADRVRTVAVRDVSFTVDDGEFLCIFGPSGCGKTTILNMLAGFLTPTKGEIRIGGKPVVTGRQDRGVVFQDFAQLFPWRTARRNVEFGLEIRGIPEDERRRIAFDFLRMVKLESFVESFPHQLSGGMQQRVAIARALAYNPAVLLMDEPFAALDAMTRDEMQNLLTEVWQRTRKTVVYITHNVAEAVYLADKVLVLAPHPGTVKTMVRLELPRPRDPLSTEFVAMQRELLGQLKQ